MWYRNSGKWIRELFPNQTGSILVISIWSIVYIADLIAVVYLANCIGITLLDKVPQMRSLFIFCYVLAAFVLFFAEAKVYNVIFSKIKK